MRIWSLFNFCSCFGSNCASKTLAKVIHSILTRLSLHAWCYKCFLPLVLCRTLRFVIILFCHTNNMSQGAGNLVDLMQHSMAKYGDNTGTRSLVKAVPAEKKCETYYAILGRQLGKWYCKVVKLKFICNPVLGLYCNCCLCILSLMEKEK